MRGRIENDIGAYWLDAEGLLRISAKSGIEQSREQAEDAMRIARELAAGTKRPAVIVLAGIKGLSRGARGVYIGPLGEAVFSAVAIAVENSSIARTVVNFMLRVSLPPFPTRMFETEAEALVWARSYLRPADRGEP